MDEVAPCYIEAEEQHLLRYQQLAETEDARDRGADQLSEAHALLEWAESLIIADNGDFSGWLRDYAAFAEKYPQEDEEEE